MPNLRRIPADAPPARELSVSDAEKEITKLDREADRHRKARWEARQRRDLAFVADTDAAFAAVLAQRDDLAKQVARVRAGGGTGKVTVVPVSAANESGNAGEVSK